MNDMQKLEPVCDEILDTPLLGGEFYVFADYGDAVWHLLGCVKKKMINLTKKKLGWTINLKPTSELEKQPAKIMMLAVSDGMYQTVRYVFLGCKNHKCSIVLPHMDGEAFYFLRMEFDTFEKYVAMSQSINPNPKHSPC